MKLWKHHAAQPEADRINAVAAERGEPWLPRYGGKISSEWFFAKALQILDEAPEVYARADRLIEACDWIVWQLTGVETRNACAAGYKAMWSKRDGFPSPDYFAALDPRFEHVVDEKMSRTLAAAGRRAGGLTERAAAWTGLRAGTPVAVGERRRPRLGPGGDRDRAGDAGDDHGHEQLPPRCSATSSSRSRACAASSRTASCRATSATRPGQSALGDIFAWFVEHAVPPSTTTRRGRAASSLHDVLAEEAARLRPGESGLLALDWWNGNRSVLVDADLQRPARRDDAGDHARRRSTGP